MKAKYRGFEIEVTREKCLGGWYMTYLSVFRMSDQYEVICDLTEGNDTVSSWIGWMKNRVDGFIKDPSEEALQNSFTSDEDYAERIKEHRLENIKTEQLHGG